MNFLTHQLSDLSPQIYNCMDSERQLTAELITLYITRDELQSLIRRASDVSTQRLDKALNATSAAVHRRDHDAVTSMRESLRGSVYGPLIAELKVNHDVIAISRLH